MDTFNTLLVALLASGAVGMGVSFIIQVGKLLAPQYFPDSSADNWRLGLIVLTAGVIMTLNAFNVPMEIKAVEAFFTSLAALGATVMPLLILFANWIAKSTYKNLLKGVWKIGKSYTPKSLG